MSPVSAASSGGIRGGQRGSVANTATTKGYNSNNGPENLRRTAHSKIQTAAGSSLKDQDEGGIYLSTAGRDEATPFTSTIGSGCLSPSNFKKNAGSNAGRVSYGTHGDDTVVNRSGRGE